MPTSGPDATSDIVEDESMMDMTLGQGSCLEKTLPQLEKERSIALSHQEQARTNLFHGRADVVKAQGSIESLQRRIEDLTTQIDALKRANPRPEESA